MTFLLVHFMKLLIVVKQTSKYYTTILPTIGLCS